MDNLTFAHSGNAGDIIYALPSIKQICADKNADATLFIRLNVSSNFTSEQHPLGNVMMNQTMYDMLYPLLMNQPYIKNVIGVNNESTPIIDYDLDKFRKDYRNLSSGNIALWYGNSYHELRPNLFEKSITVEPIKNEMIIVNRTSRYNNLMIDYSILMDLPDVYFVGTDKEFTQLSIHNPNIKHLKVKDFYEMSQYIAGCRLFIGGQSMAFAIAEQLKVKRILEQFVHAPNVIPQGGEYFVTHNDTQFKKCLYLSLNGEGKNHSATQTRDSYPHQGC